MGHSSGLVTTNEALRRVFLPFLQPSLIPSPPYCAETHLQLSAMPPSPTSPRYRPQQRHYASFRSMGGNVIQDHPLNYQKKEQAPPDRPPRDEEK
ncbi:hypothetical protein ABVK25_006158 [Lepraria finkii]|uniref:Uncharacterized protein n=1 Tax=Lepraria finkii TaxID=1340010 RepID=A0ABR4B9F8_9LECA